jgi:methylthioribose-1-phosphate isomerase
VTESEDIADVDEFLALSTRGRGDHRDTAHRRQPVLGAERMKASRPRQRRPPTGRTAEAHRRRGARDAGRGRGAQPRHRRNGAELIEPGSRVLTHCNAGSLATAYFGTALGVIFTAAEQGKIAGVWVDETRPVLQGRA